MDRVGTLEGGYVYMYVYVCSIHASRHTTRVYVCDPWIGSAHCSVRVCICVGMCVYVYVFHV